MCLSVTSYGIPIDPQAAEKILNRGFRGKQAADKVPAGTGFGLYLVKRIMELHGGNVSVELAGKTSKFKVCFPEKLFK